MSFIPLRPYKKSKLTQHCSISDKIAVRVIYISLSVSICLGIAVGIEWDQVWDIFKKAQQAKNAGSSGDAEYDAYYLRQIQGDPIRKDEFCVKNF